MKSPSAPATPTSAEPVTPAQRRSLRREERRDQRHDQRRGTPAKPRSGTPATRRAAKVRRRRRAAMALVATALSLSVTSIVAVYTVVAYTPAPGFADLVRDDSRLDAFAALSDSETDALGLLVCSELQAERSRVELANQIAESHSVSTDEGVAFVRVATTHLCPD